MNKTQERRILAFVYGCRDTLEVVENEQPDFLCRVSATCSFGVEVTEFFHSESAARLERIPDYTADLLNY